MKVLIRVMEACDLVDLPDRDRVDALELAEQLIGSSLSDLVSLAAGVGDELPRSLVLCVLHAMVPEGEGTEVARELLIETFLARTRLIPDGMAIRLIRSASEEPLPAWMAGISEELIERLEGEGH
jgi:hypothetical protein